jgi:hypothetical protein
MGYRLLSLSTLLLSAFALATLTAQPVDNHNSRWWQDLPKDRPQAWSAEALRLMKLGARSEPLAVLEEAKRRFPQDLQIAQEYVRFASFTVQPEVTLQSYRAFFDQADSLRERLRYARSLGWWAGSAKRLPELLEEFKTRQRQEPGNAAAWLVLAAIHGGAQDQVQEDECVREAARAGSQDVEVLFEIAQFQEEAGLLDEMDQTITTAAAMDKSPRSRQKLACRELMRGDAATGLRLYDQLAAHDDWEPDALLEMSEALMLVGEWPRVLALLTQQADLHPADYRVRCMLALAQEDEGLLEAAVASWLKVLDIHQERPGILMNLSLRPWSMVSLPKGTDVWMPSGVYSQAYDYRHRISYRAKGHVIAKFDREMLPQYLSWVPSYAFAHLREIVFDLSPASRQSLLKDLERLGYPDADDLLNIPLQSNLLRVDGEFLEKHPNNKALHASWYLDKEQFSHRGGMMISRLVMTMPNSEPTPGRLYQCFKLFAEDHPELALNAATALLLSERTLEALHRTSGWLGLPSHQTGGDLTRISAFALSFATAALSAERTLQALPAVIGRLGLPSHQTLYDLTRISERAAELKNQTALTEAISARLEHWLRQDRITSAAREPMEGLVKLHAVGNPRLTELLTELKQQENWGVAQHVPRTYFNNQLIGPGDGIDHAPTTRRPEAPHANPHEFHQAQRRAADASASAVKEHLQEQHRDLALKELRHYLELAADDWLDYAYSDGSYIRLDHLNHGAHKPDAALVEEAIQLFANDANPARYGALLEMTGRIDEAGQTYQRAHQAGASRLHLLRRLAVLTARTDVPAGLKILQSMPAIHLPNCIDALASESGPGNGAYSIPALRLANARLLTAWLEQRAAAHKPLPHTLRLEGSAGQLARGDDHSKQFGSPWQPATGSMAPYPPAFHEALDGLCRAFMKFPATALTGFATLAAVANSAGQPMEPHYQHSLRLLRDRRITDLDTPDSLRWSHRFPDRNASPLLHAAVFATEYAVLSQPAGTFEKTVLPVVLQAYGSESGPALRTYAAMCAAGDQDFIACAEKWLGTKESNDWRRALFPENIDGMRVALVERLWKEKNLTVPIAGLLKQQPQ